MIPAEFRAPIDQLKAGAGNRTSKTHFLGQSRVGSFWVEVGVVPLPGQVGVCVSVTDQSALLILEVLPVAIGSARWAGGEFGEVVGRGDGEGRAGGYFVSVSVLTPLLDVGRL